uniref:Delta-theraphotoxin-Cg1a 3 n=1 Tax=Chilobrachys guangxiensis TaxID=278060 RepID=JZT1C_CHIGU|nr:RecName: Full=Delta-theraphotoxin-Cg1a 3; Short=Delta-TRTX-Cg1a; AltName: Full=Jingzhaotoxin-1.3; Short=JZTX-1.3; AltName: Full=Jingzhaotoxin-I.3; Short=JZTX-I.3; AltName: Full=Peptide F5-24.92; Flags: Precursor [Chilobrachys guangxiensis]ABY71668.1 cystine knot toxin [Chilobrachys guangxiensis]
MKTSILFVIFSLALVFALSPATEIEETDRACGQFWWKCGEGKPPCCANFACKIGLYLCIWSP